MASISKIVRLLSTYTFWYHAAADRLKPEAAQPGSERGRSSGAGGEPTSMLIRGDPEGSMGVQVVHGHRLSSKDRRVFRFLCKLMK